MMILHYTFSKHTFLFDNLVFVAKVRGLKEICKQGGGSGPFSSGLSGCIQKPSPKTKKKYMFLSSLMQNKDSAQLWQTY